MGNPLEPLEFPLCGLEGFLFPAGAVYLDLALADVEGPAAGIEEIVAETDAIARHVSFLSTRSA